MSKKGLTDEIDQLASELFWLWSQRVPPRLPRSALQPPAPERLSFRQLHYIHAVLAEAIQYQDLAHREIRDLKDKLHAATRPTERNEP